MKRLFLLLAAGSISASVIGQEAHKSVVFTDAANMTGRTFSKAGLPDFKNRGKVQGAAAKTTSATSRWIRYADLFDTVSVDAGAATGLSSVLMWHDTLARMVYSGPQVAHVTMSSVGLVIDPSLPKLNNILYGFAGEMKIRPQDALTFDSVALLGNYMYNATKTAVKDTLRITALTGSGSTSADIYSGYSLAAGGHYGAVSFLDVDYDSITNVGRAQATPYGTLGASTKTIILDNSGSNPAWGDTTSTGIWVGSYALNAPLSMPANGFLGATVSFRSGDASFPTTLTAADNDTVANLLSGEVKYNMFAPIVRYRTANADGTGIDWAPYDVADSTVGLFKRQPNFRNGWKDTYIPTWAWSSGSGASTYQYPEIYFHVTCTTCSELYDNTGVASVNNESSVAATPNPAANTFTVVYSQATAADATITLTNMVGQVVATQNFSNAKEVKATFNTANLPSGVYMYTVNAQGQSATGRVVVAH